MENTASVWEDPHCPFRVEWDPGKLNQMRKAVVDAFYALPRGGIEIGGLLLGRFEGKVIHIENFAPMECEHLTGPSFVLSPKDQAALERQLASLDGQVVGWFHSHTRSDLHFSPLDVEIHNRFFPKAAHIAMVVRPVNSQAPKANYFFRGPRAEIISGKNPFVVEPTKGKLAPEEDPIENSITGVSDETLETPAPVPGPNPAAVPVQRELVPPVFLQEPGPVKPRDFLWLALGFIVFVLGAAAYFTRASWIPR